MKTCSRCGNQKPPDQFHKNPRMRDGRIAQCIECVREGRKKFRDANVEKIRQQHRDSYLRNRDIRLKRVADYYARHPDVNARAVEKYRAANPDAVRARKMTTEAIRIGRLQVKPCERCGDGIGIQAHHDDYSKPLDVMWLCPKHHGERHRELNEQRRKAAA